MTLLVRLGRVPVKATLVAKRPCDEEILTQKLEIILASLQLVEADIGLDSDTRARVSKIGIVGRHNGETLALGLPCKLGDSIFQFHHFDRVIFLAKSEDFQVAEDRLLRFGVTVNLDAKEVTLVLPVEFTLQTKRLAQ